MYGAVEACALTAFITVYAYVHEKVTVSLSYKRHVTRVVCPLDYLMSAVKRLDLPVSLYFSEVIYPLLYVSRGQYTGYTEYF